MAGQIYVNICSVMARYLMAPVSYFDIVDKNMIWEKKELGQKLLPIVFHRGKSFNIKMPSYQCRTPHYALCGVDVTNAA